MKTCKLYTDQLFSEVLFQIEGQANDDPENLRQFLLCYVV